MCPERFFMSTVVDKEIAKSFVPGNVEKSNVIFDGALHKFTLRLSLYYHVF